MLSFIIYWQRPFLVHGTYCFIKSAYIYILYECSYPDVPAFDCMAAPPPSPHLLPPPTLLSKSAPGAVATSTMEVFPWTTGCPTTVSLHSGPALQSKPWLTRPTQEHGMFCVQEAWTTCAVSHQHLPSPLRYSLLPLQGSQDLFSDLKFPHSLHLSYLKTQTCHCF